MIDVLDAEGVQYAIKAPFYQWLGLKERIAECRYWERVDKTVECFELWLPVGYVNPAQIEDQQTYPPVKIAV